VTDDARTYGHHQVTYSMQQLLDVSIILLRAGSTLLIVDLSHVLSRTLRCCCGGACSLPLETLGLVGNVRVVFCMTARSCFQLVCGKCRLTSGDNYSRESQVSTMPDEIDDAHEHRDKHLLQHPPKRP
jgi:hypothetical protein